MKEEFPVVFRITERGMPRRQVHEIVCSVCRETDFITANSRTLPPHAVETKFRNGGWSVSDVGKHLCPNCASERRVKARSGGSAMLKTTMTPAIDDAMRRAIPLLYVALEDKYDRAAKAYRGEATDASIAAELHLPLAIVAERRERDF